MNILWSELKLSFRRLFRRKVNTNLLLVTFAVSVTLSALSWTLFHTVHLSQPTFDPKGEYLILANQDRFIISTGQPSRKELETYKASLSVADDFAYMAFYGSIFIETPGGRERVLGAFPTSRALQITGAIPLHGALFTEEDDIQGAPIKLLLSERLWENHFHRDPAVLGKLMKIRDEQGTIVGIVSKEYRFPNDQDIWISYGGMPADDDDWSVRAALIKLQPGITKERAEEDLRAIHSTFPEDSPSVVRKRLPELRTYRDALLLPELRTSAMILMALSLLFLAVSCANAANLMVIDFLGRRPELAASLALGVPRSGIARSLCWQVILVALISALIASALLPVIGPLLYERIQMLNAPYWLTYQFSWNSIGMVFLFSGIAAVVTLLVPLVYLLYVDSDHVIREHAYASRGTGRALWRRMLLTGQIALLTILGVSTALLVRSNNNVSAAHWGYNAEGLFNGKISVGSIKFTEEEERRGRIASVHNSFLGIRNRPETASAAYMRNGMGYSLGPYCTYATTQEALVNGVAMGKAFYSDISDQFFDTLGVPLVEGEDFREELTDENWDLRSVIINESLARKLWPGESPLQRRLYVHYSWMEEGEPPRVVQVQGVVRDFQACGPRAESNDAIYTHFHEESGRYTYGVHIYVRDKAGVPSTKSLSDAIHGVEPRTALYFPTTVKQRIDLTLNSMRMTSDLSIVFALSAVILCAIGVYSLTVTQVLQSSREFGIRMALGAEPTKLWWCFSRAHLLNTLIGVGLGIIGATQLMRVMESLLYGVDPYGVSTYVVVAILILGVAAFSCLPSLARLKRISPSDCLRSL